MWRGVLQAVRKLMVNKINRVCQRPKWGTLEWQGGVHAKRRDEGSATFGVHPFCRNTINPRTRVTYLDCIVTVV